MKDLSNGIPGKPKDTTEPKKELSLQLSPEVRVHVALQLYDTLDALEVAHAAIHNDLKKAEVREKSKEADEAFQKAVERLMHLNLLTREALDEIIKESKGYFGEQT
jgi:hypothetical protein